MHLLSLRFEGVRGKCVGREQIEGELRPSCGARGNPGEQLVTEPRQMGGETERRLMDRSTQPLPQCQRRCWTARVQPGHELVARHCAKSRTNARGRAPGPPRLSGSPYPPPAEIGRAPP